MAKKRRPPRRRASNTAQVNEALVRYDRLLTKSVRELTVLSARINKYRKRLAYYQKRADDLAAANLAAAEQTAHDHGRNLRSVRVDG